MLVAILVINKQVAHRARERQIDFLAVRELQGELLGEALGQARPDAVGVKLEGQADLFDESPRVLDDVAASVSDHRGHLHRVPASALLHDVSVEGVEDDFVRQL